MAARISDRLLPYLPLTPKWTRRPRLQPHTREGCAQGRSSAFIGLPCPKKIAGRIVAIVTRLYADSDTLSRDRPFVVIASSRRNE
ncbi:MAG TPA: hypothetical protein VEK56_13980 [Vicinamibacterales bacterium]|nr:hypothetical protein [Vicinamibacterales bacterium]